MGSRITQAGGWRRAWPVYRSSYSGLILVSLAYGLVRAAYWGIRPIWDGGVYWSEFLRVNHAPFDWARYTISNHTSQIALALSSMLFALTRDSILGFNIWSTVLGLIGLVVFFHLALELFRDWIQPAEASVLTACFAFHPTVLGPTLNFSFDSTLTFFFLSLWLALLKGRRWLAVGLGVCLLFTKESGIVLLPWPWLHVWATRRAGLSVREWFVRHLWVLIVPMAAMCFYGYSKVFIRHEAMMNNAYTPSWDLIKAALGFEHHFAYFRARHRINEFYVVGFWEFPQRVRQHLQLIFLLNFNWLVSLGLLVASAAWIARSIRQSRPILHPWIGVGGLILGCSWALTRALYWSNPRYYMPLMPLLILAVSTAFQTLGLNKRARCILMSGIGALWLWQCFRSVDPLSNWRFGTIPFGRHRLVTIADWTKEWPGGGRDQLIYNLEWTYFPRLIDRILAELKPDDRSVIASANYAGELWTPLDRRTYQPSFDRKTNFSPRYLEFRDWVKLEVIPPTIYYIHLPQFALPDLSRIAARYRSRREFVSEIDGYALRVIVFADLRSV
jgi:hypothetical protein